MMNKVNSDKLAEYSVVGKKSQKKKREKRPLSSAQKLIVLLSVAAASVVTAVIVLSLYFAGIISSVIPIEKRKQTSQEEDVLSSFVEYTHKDGKTGKYATITFVCEGKEYEVKVYLLSTYAPNTVNNFISYVKSGFYNGTAVQSAEIEYDENKNPVSGRMVCGGFVRNEDGSLSTKLPDEGAEPIKGEFYYNGYTGNLLSNTAGVIGMMHTPQNNDDATTNFYILPYDDTSLNGKYAAFGKVTTEEGLRAVQYLATKPESVTIKTITVSG